MQLDVVLVSRTELLERISSTEELEQRVKEAQMQASPPLTLPESPCSQTYSRALRSSDGLHLARRRLVAPPAAGAVAYEMKTQTLVAAEKPLAPWRMFIWDAGIRCSHLLNLVVVAFGCRAHPLYPCEQRSIGRAADFIERSAGA